MTQLELPSRYVMFKNSLYPAIKMLKRMYKCALSTEHMQLQLDSKSKNPLNLKKPYVLHPPDQLHLEHGRLSFSFSVDMSMNTTSDACTELCRNHDERVSCGITYYWAFLKDQGIIRRVSNNHESFSSHPSNGSLQQACHPRVSQNDAER